MIIQCDKCGAKFQLDDDKVSDKGTKVRCSKCKAVFTVKKGSASAPGASASPPKAGGQGEDDPFADFNFSDDMDFGEQDEDVAVSKKPAAAPAPADDDSPGFLDDEGPAISFDDAPAKPSPPPSSASESSGDNFDFSDEEFAFSDQPDSAPPAPGKGAGGAPEDFNFEDGGLADSPSPAQASAPSADEEWGNVSFSADSGGGAGPDAGEDMDEAGFGDFQFDADDGLPSTPVPDGDMEMDVVDFVRSPKGGAPAGDELEASIGDGEAEQERRAPSSELPPPPKPVIRTETPDQSSGLLWTVILAVLVLGSLVGGVGYTHSQGWFTFGDLFTGRLGNLCNIPSLTQTCIDQGWMEEPDAGSVDITGKTEVEQVTRKDGSLLIVVKGNVTNNTNKVQMHIRVEAKLKDKTTDEVVAEGESYCGVSLDDQELRTKAVDLILVKATSALNCLEVVPGESRPFAVVFHDFPQGDLKLVAPRVVEFKTLGE